MSGKDSNPLKNPLYWVVKQDSRGASQLGRTFHWDYLKNEGKTNQENPGRAITKAAEYAATWYLGGLLGGAFGDAGAGSGDAATAGTDAAESGGTLGLNAAGSGTSPYLASQVGSASGLTAAQLATAGNDALNTGLLGGAQQGLTQLAGGMPGEAQQLAAAQALAQQPANPGLLNSIQNGYSSVKSAAGNAIDSLGNKAASMAYRGAVPGAGAQQADMLAAQTGDFGGYGLAQTMKAAAGAQGLTGYQQLVGQYGGQLLGNLSGVGASPTGKMLALEMGKGLLMPQRQPMPQGAPMRGGGSEQPLTSPYSGQNSLTINSMSEAEKQRLRALGYNVPY